MMSRHFRKADDTVQISAPEIGASFCVIPIWYQIFLVGDVGASWWQQEIFVFCPKFLKQQE